MNPASLHHSSGQREPIGTPPFGQTDSFRDRLDAIANGAGAGLNGLTPATDCRG